MGVPQVFHVFQREPGHGTIACPWLFIQCTGSHLETLLLAIHAFLCHQWLKFELALESIAPWLPSRFMGYKETQPQCCLRTYFL